MYYPSFKDFLKLSHQGNVIPIYKEINADLDTPVSAFLKIEKGPYAFLLESVEGQEKLARYSFLGSRPSLVFTNRGSKSQIIYPGRKQTEYIDSPGGALAQIKSIMQDMRAVSVFGLPRFCGGLVGFMGYDAVRFFEKLPDKNRDDLKLPDAVFILADTLLVFDHLDHTIKIVANCLLPARKKLSRAALKKYYGSAIGRINSIERKFRRPISAGNLASKDSAGIRPKMQSNFTPAGFQAIVRRGKAYIRKGDIVQVVLSQRFKIRTKKDAFSIYRDLRSLNPSPYMYYLKFKDVAIVGASPEMLVRCEDGVIQTRPIAGTRPRGKDVSEDLRLEKELLKDEKERAEHLMLVDLGRNDIGRVSLSGTVKVSEFMGVERYSHVMHLVSEVRGRLDRGRHNIYDVLQAAFPAGTVSGSPKIRAMEIIDELENLRRGPYAGCVGYFSFSGNMDTCITIRTVVLKKGCAYIQAGAGIVADSVPQREYQETVNKAKALIEAVNR